MCAPWLCLCSLWPQWVWRQHWMHTTQVYNVEQRSLNNAKKMSAHQLYTYTHVILDTQFVTKTYLSIHYLNSSVAFRGMQVTCEHARDTLRLRCLLTVPLWSPVWHHLQNITVTHFSTKNQYFIHLTTITCLKTSEQKCNHHLAVHSEWQRWLHWYHDIIMVLQNA